MKITLATLPYASAQDVFNFVGEHLITQGEKSIDEDAFDYSLIYCKYRSGNNKCAAGCLISDEEYNEDMEKISWRSLVHDGLVPSEHSYLINRLQVIHDNVASLTKSEVRENWYLDLGIMAKAHCFDMTHIDNIYEQFKNSEDEE